jgi:hypothetical protein
MRGASPLGGPARSTGEQMQQQSEAASASAGAEPQGSPPSLAGRILGLAGLVFAVMMLRGRQKDPSKSTA